MRCPPYQRAEQEGCGGIGDSGAALGAAEPSADGTWRGAGKVLLYPGILRSHLHVPGPPVWSLLPLGPPVPHLGQPERVPPTPGPSAGSTPPSLFAVSSHRDPNSSLGTLSSRLCSSAPPSPFGAPQSPQPCGETKPSLFTCRPHFPSGLSQSSPFPPGALRSPPLTPSSRDCAGAAFAASPWSPLVTGSHQDPLAPHRTRIKRGSCFQPSWKVFPVLAALLIWGLE